MSDFKVEVIEFHGEDHPDADRLTIGHFGDYQYIVGKHEMPDGTFQTIYDEGQLVCYIPEGAIVPNHLLIDMELEGKLSGPEHNRVRAMKLRGVLSQGIVYGSPSDRYPTPAWNPSWKLGDDVTEEMGIEKYVPVIPVFMRGKMEKGPESSLYQSFDIENIKRYPNLIEEGEWVSITEKLHGSFCACIMAGDRFAVTSKGFLGKGLTIVEDPTNVYWRAILLSNIEHKMRTLMADMQWSEMILMGEALGVQDLRYSLAPGEVAFRAFDMRVFDSSMPEKIRWIDPHHFFLHCDKYGIPAVPELYRGPCSKDAVEEHTSGKSTLANHIREGIVIKPTTGRYDPHLGRVILKSVSEKYLLRKGETTEYQ